MYSCKYHDSLVKLNLIMAKKRQEPLGETLEGPAPELPSGRATDGDMWT